MQWADAPTGGPLWAFLAELRLEKQGMELLTGHRGRRGDGQNWSPGPMDPFENHTDAMDHT